QRSISQKQPGSQGGQGSQEPVRAPDNNNNVVNGRNQKLEPLIPIELQLLPQFYASECLVLKPGQESGAYKFQPPRSLLDSSREIKMEPAELRWSAAGGLQKISIMNQTGDRQAIKVKCSDNNIYRVNPVFAFIEPGQTLNVDVMRQNGSNKVDKLVFITSKASPEDNNPKQIFKPGTTNNTMMVLPLLATQPPATVAVAN
uniref:Major sperm protein n=1 Tax=Panagrolaimus sp. JU765 TaxID=591449 RepID=A0AC34Q0H8_9BILA